MLCHKIMVDVCGEAPASCTLPVATYLVLLYPLRYGKARFCTLRTYEAYSHSHSHRHKSPVDEAQQ